jgi:hypothetical protein
MNKERILELADIIEAQPHCFQMGASQGFGMNHFTHQCGSPSCLGGWASATFDPDYPSFETNHQIAESAENVLDLFEKQARNLFFPEVYEKYGHITPAEAAGVLRNLAETGEVVWPHKEGFMKEEHEA